MRVEKAAIKLNASTRWDQGPTYSPDGKRIAFASNRSGSHEIWVCNSDGSNAVQLTSFEGPFFTANPRWSPDGLSIFFKSAQEGHEGWYVISYEGGRAKRLGPEDAVPVGWSRDGKWIYFHSNRSGEDQLWRMPWPTSGHGEGAVQVTRKGGGSDVVESSDGRFAFYLKDSESDIASVWKVAVKGGEETQVLEPVLNGLFAVTGQGIYFIPDSKPRCVRFFSFHTGKVVTIADIPQEPGWGFSVSPDGHWLVYTASQPIGSDLMLVENFR
jgi:Tol biopolymer transport system component